MRLMKVKGLGQVRKRPDLIVIEFQIVSEGMDYDKVVKDLNQRSYVLKQDIMNIGFSKEELKTTQYTVETQYRYDEGKKEFLGFKAVHALELSFLYNQKLLNEVLKTISNSLSDPLFNVLFEIKDKEKFIVECLNAAVLNAKRNAKVIAASANIKLGKIMNIEYDEKPVVYRSPVMLENTKMNQSDVDITPGDVKGHETVYMHWEIEDII